MAFDPYLRRMAETEKMLTVKVVCLEVLYHPSNFLPSLKKHPVQRVENSFWVEKVFGKMLRFDSVLL